MKPVNFAIYVSLLISLLLSGHCIAEESDYFHNNVCDQFGGHYPGTGRQFIGHLRNEDYDLSLSIPRGLAGWSGVSDSAPFHGFKAFLGNDGKSCIIFEIHIRVDDAPQTHSGTVLRSLGRATGWESEERINVNGAEIISMVTDFSYERNDFTADGFVRLIAPYGDKGKYEIFIVIL